MSRLLARRSGALLPLFLACLLACTGALLACAGRANAPPPAPPAVLTPTGPPVTPPPLAVLGPGDETPRPRDASDPGSARSQLRRAIVDAVWTTVRNKHYDKALGGVDWEAARRRYEPLALAAPDDPTFYRVLNEMLGELGQSHLEVSGPGAAPSPTLEEAHTAPATSSGEAGDPGVVVRAIEGRPTITYVRPGSSGERAGLKPGFLVTHIGGRPLALGARAGRAPRPVEERFYLRLEAARQLHGPAGSRVTLRGLDHQDRPVEVPLVRERFEGKPVKIGILPPFHPEVRVFQAGDVGVIAWNLFLTEGVLPAVQRAIDGFRARGVRGIVLDLRGNPGGLGAMAIPVAARLVDEPLVLGTIQFRDHTQTLTASPSLGVKPFLGPVVVVTDEGTASTSEILAAGLQEAKRAVIVGDATLGAVLPSMIEALPGGAVLQFVVADFRTPKGVLIEGRGVQPDKRVIETRAALVAGRDPVLDAALVAARASRR